MTKSKVPFCSLEVDHALEQEIQNNEMLRGTRGITQKPTTLTRFVLIAQELAHLSAEVELLAGVSRKQKTPRTVTICAALIQDK